MTSRIDVIELLEKRVKSRFSHNVVVLKPLSKTKELLERLKYLLSLSTNCKVKSDIRKKWDNNIDLLISDLQMQNLMKDFLKSSNNIIKFNMFIVSIEMIIKCIYIKLNS